jgi:hypothetical protein
LYKRHAKYCSSIPINWFLPLVSPLPKFFVQVHQDMSAPFSHYFVFTGHNSYLTGNQLNSDSSDIPIIKALQRGVRVIELDMWPNSSKTNVDILHGGYEFCFPNTFTIFIPWNYCIVTACEYNCLCVRMVFLKIKKRCGVTSTQSSQNKMVLWVHMKKTRIYA